MIHIARRSLQYVKHLTDAKKNDPDEIGNQKSIIARPQLLFQGQEKTNFECETLKILQIASMEGGLLPFTYSLAQILFPEVPTGDLVYIPSDFSNATIVYNNRPAAWQTWGIGLLIVAITAFGPSLAILGVPFLSKIVYERFMNFLVALGVGTLSGSTLYVLIPQAFGIDEEQNSNYLVKSTIVIAAIYAFFGVDRALAYLLHYRKSRSARRKMHKSTLDAVLHGRTDRSYSSTLNNNNNEEPRKFSFGNVPQITVCDSEPSNEKEKDPDAMDRIFEIEKNQLKNEMEVAVVSNALTRSFSTRRRSAIVSAVKYNGQTVEAPAELNKDIAKIYDIPNICEPPIFERMDSTFSKKEPTSPTFTNVPVSPAPSLTYPCRETEKPKDDIVSVCVEVVEQTMINTAELEVATVAYMIIFGSTANNFVDGMSNGAAFADSFSKGLSIGIAVIAQQLPQEIGTLAILIRSGLGLKRTLLLALIPNSFSFIGFVVGVLLGNAGDTYEAYIFSVSSGMYLYIFLGTLLPEIRDSVNEMIKTDLPESILATITQFFGTIIGVVFMLLMSIYGKKIQI